MTTQLVTTSVARQVPAAPSAGSQATRYPISTLNDRRFQGVKSNKALSLLEDDPEFWGPRIQRGPNEDENVKAIRKKMKKMQQDKADQEITSRYGHSWDLPSRLEHGEPSSLRKADTINTRMDEVYADLERKLQEDVTEMLAKLTREDATESSIEKAHAQEGTPQATAVEDCVSGIQSTGAGSQRQLEGATQYSGPEGENGSREEGQKKSDQVTTANVF